MSKIRYICQAVIPAKPAERARAGIQDISGGLDTGFLRYDETGSADFFIELLIQDTSGVYRGGGSIHHRPALFGLVEPDEVEFMKRVFRGWA